MAQDKTAPDCRQKSWTIAVLVGVVAAVGLVVVSDWGALRAIIAAALLAGLVGQVLIYLRCEAEVDDMADAEPEVPVVALEDLGPADDLTRITGIGPKLQEALAALGVTRFAQIAAWGDADLAWIDSQLPRFKGRAIRDGWVDQAKALSAESGNGAAEEGSTAQ